jgi:hypothetical protein
MAVIAFASVATIGLMQIAPSLAWTFPRYFPLVTLLRLDAIDVTAAEDAIVFETWIEIWLLMIPFAFAAKWFIFRVLPRH